MLASVRNRRRLGWALSVAVVAALLAAVSITDAARAETEDSDARRPPLELGDDIVVLPPPVTDRYTLFARAPRSNPYQHDPWVAYKPLTGAPTGTHVWEVWACNSEFEGPPTLSPSEFIAAYGDDAADWFTEMSRGRYRPRFEPGGSFSSVFCVFDAPTPSGDRGVVIIRGGCCGLGTPGALATTSSHVELIAGTRRAEVGTVEDSEVHPIILILVHEMGHALGWPHVPAADWDSDVFDDDYNNLADVMSGNQAEGGVVGPTAAVNLYASGWIDPSEVAVWNKGTATIRLGTLNSSRTKMVMIPDEVQGKFHTVSVDPVAVSSSAPRGVLVHHVDQRPMGQSGYCVTNEACFLVSRTTEALVPAEPVLVDFFNRVDPMFDVGDSIEVDRWRIEVTSSHADGFTIRLTGEAGPRPPRFADVGIGHTFKDQIERLADSGITRGCNPPENSRFCPDAFVTRGQMAAFLARALELSVASSNPFSDTRGHTFENDASALARAGVTRGCNPPENSRFCPDAFVTRGQMAAFLDRALGLAPYNGPDRFTDDNGNIFEDAIERLAHAGITLGCNPPQNTRFCPDDRVTRGQMAAFLDRAGLTE